MTAQRISVIRCDYPQGCPYTFEGEEWPHDLRKRMALSGWTVYEPTGRGRQDRCPEHRADVPLAVATSEAVVL